MVWTRCRLQLFGKERCSLYVVDSRGTVDLDAEQTYELIFKQSQLSQAYQARFFAGIEVETLVSTEWLQQFNAPEWLTELFKLWDLGNLTEEELLNQVRLEVYKRTFS